MPDLSGHLHLHCASDQESRTRISHQSVRAPFHLSKPYWDGRTLIVPSVNVTAGVLSGDALETYVKIDANAKALLFSPSAQRVHSMRTGRATIRQKFQVDAGGWLEVMPELLIPQRQCAFEQTTDIEIAKGGSGYFLESIAPGRVARGESLEFSTMKIQLSIRYAGSLLLREQYSLSSNCAALNALKRLYQTPYYAIICLITEQSVNESLWGHLENLEGVASKIGCTSFEGILHVVRVVAGDAISLRKSLNHIRTTFSDNLVHLRSCPRKY